MSFNLYWILFSSILPVTVYTPAVLISIIVIIFKKLSNLLYGLLFLSVLRPCTFISNTTLIDSLSYLLMAYIAFKPLKSILINLFFSFTYWAIFYILLIFSFQITPKSTYLSEIFNYTLPPFKYCNVYIWVLVNNWDFTSLKMQHI